MFLSIDFSVNMRFLLALAIAPFWFQVTEESLLVTKFETCSNAPIKLYTTFKTIDNRYQVVTGNYTAPIINGENLKATMKAKYLVGSVWVPLFTFNENKGVCTLALKYIGPLMADIFQAVGLIPHCPIPKGNFRLTNYELNPNMMRLQLPDGKIQTKIIGIEKTSGNVAFCVDVDLVINSK